MLTEQPILITSLTCKEADGILKNRFVSFSGLYCSGGDKPLGVSNADTDLNEMLPVTAQGIALIISGAAITVGSAIESVDDGYAVPNVGGTIAGYALDSASGSGQSIRILLS